MKHLLALIEDDHVRVAPRRGAWIETIGEAVLKLRNLASHPAGVRGLKHFHRLVPYSTVKVAPRRGAWIETEKSIRPSIYRSMVAPRRGAWIETGYMVFREFEALPSRTPQGCVD